MVQVSSPSNCSLRSFALTCPAPFVAPAFTTHCPTLGGPNFYFEGLLCFLTPSNSLNMAQIARGYFDALRALSGDSEFKDARQRLIEGLSDATLRDVISECIELNSSRFVQEQIIKLLLGSIVAQRPPQAHGHGYLDALCALSGNSDFAGARNDLIEHLTDATMNGIITECLARDTSRSWQEQVIEFLLDIIVEQTKSRAQEGAATVKKEDVEELLEHVAEEGQEQLQAIQYVVEQDAPLVRGGSHATEQEDTPGTGQIMAANKHSRGKLHSLPADRARNLHDSQTSTQVATLEDGVFSTEIKNEEEEDEGELEEGEVVETIEHRSDRMRNCTPPKMIKVKLCLPHNGLMFGSLDRIPHHVKIYLLSRIATNYGFESIDQASYNNILRYRHLLYRRDRCINTLLHSQGPCTWMYARNDAACDYCVQTNQVCGRLATSPQGKNCFVLHPLPLQLRNNIQLTELEYWISQPYNARFMERANQLARDTAEANHARQIEQANKAQYVELKARDGEKPLMIPEGLATTEATTEVQNAEQALRAGEIEQARLAREVRYGARCERRHVVEEAEICRAVPKSQKPRRIRTRVSLHIKDMKSWIAKQI